MRRTIRERNRRRRQHATRAPDRGGTDAVAAKRRRRPAKLNRSRARRPRLDRHEGAGEGPPAPLRDGQSAWRTTSRRYLDNEPVVARPPSRIYRLRKLVRRNRVTFAAGRMVAVTLLACTIVSTSSCLKEREARHLAETRRATEARSATRGHHAISCANRQRIGKGSRRPCIPVRRGQNANRPIACWEKSLVPESPRRNWAIIDPHPGRLARRRRPAGRPRRTALRCSSRSTSHRAWTPPWTISRYAPRSWSSRGTIGRV